MSAHFSPSVDRVMLDGDDFAKLVRGEAVKLTTARNHTFELALSDIGWDIMREHIDAAQGHGRADDGS